MCESSLRLCIRMLHLSLGRKRLGPYPANMAARCCDAQSGSEGGFPCHTHACMVVVAV